RAQHRVRTRELCGALFRGQLALAAHGLDQSLPMKRGADEARRDLERGNHCGIELPRAVTIVEADGAGVLAVHQNRHDHRALRAVARDAHAVGLGCTLAADVDALAGLKLHAEAVRLALVPRHAARIAALALDT